MEKGNYQYEYPESCYVISDKGCVENKCNRTEHCKIIIIIFILKAIASKWKVLQGAMNEKYSN